MFKSTSVYCKLLLIILLSVSFQSFAFTDKLGLPDDKNQPSLFSNTVGVPFMQRTADSIYEVIGLGYYGLEKNVFFTAYRGYQYLQSKGKLKKDYLLTICDYSQSSNNKRLYVIDVEIGLLLYNTYVSHGKNSGVEYATSFSNFDESNKSSLGFMITAETYVGKAGTSMRLNGMEKGINDNVRQRNIVFHGSKFVNEQVMGQRGVIGNSLGCPAVPFGMHTKIINVIKGGSCFFVYHPIDWYVPASAILNTPFDIVPSPEHILATIAPMQ